MITLKSFIITCSLIAFPLYSFFFVFFLLSLFFYSLSLHFLIYNAFHLLPQVFLLHPSCYIHSPFCLFCKCSFHFPCLQRTEDGLGQVRTVCRKPTVQYRSWVEKWFWRSKGPIPPVFIIEILFYHWILWLVAFLALRNPWVNKKYYLYRSVSLNWKPVVSITRSFGDEMPEAS